MDNAMDGPQARSRLSRKQQRLQRRADGECPDCGGIPGHRRIYCEMCLGRYRKAQARRADAAKADGLCPGCMKIPGRAPGKCCDTCNDRSLLRSAERRAKYRENKVCIRCGDPLKVGMSRCANCCDVSNEYLRQRRMKRFRAGLCTKCGHAAADNFFTSCSDCREIGRLCKRRSDARRA